MSTLKETSGNLRYPRKKILLTNVVAGNIASQIKVIPSANNGLGSGRVLSLPKEGIFIAENERYEIELKSGRAGTVRKSIITIGNPDACVECSFEYGFGVRRYHYGKKEHVRPMQYITAGYYDTISNPTAIDGTTGLFTAATLATMNDRMIEMINTHQGIHPEAGPVVKAQKVYKVTRNDGNAYNVTLTTGGVPTTVTHATVATFVGLLNADAEVSYAWSTGSGNTAIIYIAAYAGSVPTSGAGNTTVVEEDTMIGLEGLYVNPSYEVVNPKGFQMTNTIVDGGSQPYLDLAQVFDIFFAQKHQGSLSHWTQLDQPTAAVFNKRVIYVATETNAIHGASHTDGYVMVYEIYYPGDSATEALVAGLFEAEGAGPTDNKFPLSHLL